MYGTYPSTAAPPQPAFRHGYNPSRYTNTSVLGDAHESWTSYLLTAPFRFLTLKAVVFHVANAAFSLVAFALVWGSLVLGLSLIPVCCIGLLLLRGLCYVVHALAKVDVHLYNCITPCHEHIYVNFEFPERVHTEGLRVSPSLAEFSRESLLAILYFAVVKVPLALVSSISSLSILAVSIELLASVVSRHHVCVLSVDGQCPLGHGDAAWRFLVAGAVTLYVAAYLLHLTAHLLCKATKFFCCEYFATYSYVYASTLPRYQV
ncbi:hypothetical protein SPRG_02143 [Saprolegnia parasitica CBS 223.65]|uniref:Uncharacterized protein n=1 Tax=Saprolegnia parasitica (strain CBS 223.65) TaxID=695850 RepID=A0A067CVQ1_SAPPC|nr:hypothetical protein SPRG_02143 [Saprolegnia parasitica CBS 223.65]KDO33335.1 hypothetical protein SPRG_02143 [Saprolegnia parasitica CBS 223.65]|eukprot:XP_012196084.1 hypothetical protein SPRG_02143 [Saprolegnia parasitica CBS 223.65]